MAGVLEASMADGLFLVESSLPFFVWKKTEKESDLKIETITKANKKIQATKN